MPFLFAATIGAVVLAPSGYTEKTFWAWISPVDDSRYDLISIPAGGSTWLFAPGTVAEDFLIMMRDGRAVQANARMFDIVTDRIGIDIRKTPADSTEGGRRPTVAP
ncbi:hypothetical protein QA648_33040 (plasmid) [Rhizobium sp. CB3171]|uniref:hypothetical protein n=1 Tax=Rhizobium sp. CB3171 TaxID=3039157 RepID=UPI0024B1372A|nr:hypothetical protein [Rhizobium sp. CB3171]WFU07030.1 hypothetical protein QA648_33040 [Rhizobium sp. CB3171]